MEAVLVLDLADDLVGVGGVAPGAGYRDRVVERGVVGRVARVVRAARDGGLLVVWVGVRFAEGYSDWPAASPLFGGARAAEAFAPHGLGAVPLRELGREPGDPVVFKPRVSPFYATRLEVLLRTRGVREVVLCGVATEHVVLAAARDAHDRDLAVTVLTDAVESSSEALHDAALLVMGSYTRQIDSRRWIAEYQS